MGDEGMGCVEDPMGDFRRKSPRVELLGKNLLEESQQVSTSNCGCEYILQWYMSKVAVVNHVWVNI
jgi:hypothetical protein